MIWILALLLLVGSAQADVTRKQVTTSQFFAGTTEATSTQYFAADRSADESTSKFTSGIGKTVAGGKERPGTTIRRLDKELVWTVDPKDKSYSEMTFAEFRDMMHKGTAEMEQAQGEESADTVAEDMYEWKVEDKSESQPKTIHGWTCRNAHIEATGVNKKDSLDKVVMTVNLWNSPDIPGEKEIQEFQIRYAKALGLDQWAQTPGLQQAAMLYQKQFEQLVEAAKKAPGESVTNQIEIKRFQPKGPSVGKAIQQGVQNELMGRLPFGGKKKPPKEEKPQWEWKVKFSMNSELVEATVGPVDAAKFEVPAGFKLRKR
jgi:hypothetical protein